MKIRIRCFYLLKRYYEILQERKMKIIRLLIMLTAFLIMISSVITLYATTNRMPVYLNIVAMATLVAVITLLNFKKKQ